MGCASVRRRCLGSSGRELSRRHAGAESALFELGDERAHGAEMDLCEVSARDGVREQVARTFDQVHILLRRRELDGEALRVQRRGCSVTGTVHPGFSSSLSPSGEAFASSNTLFGDSRGNAPQQGGSSPEEHSTAGSVVERRSIVRNAVNKELRFGDFFRPALAPSVDEGRAR